MDQPVDDAEQAEEKRSRLKTWHILLIVIVIVLAIVVVSAVVYRSAYKLADSQPATIPKTSNLQLRSLQLGDLNQHILKFQQTDILNNADKFIKHISNLIADSFCEQKMDGITNVFMKVLNIVSKDNQSHNNTAYYEDVKKILKLLKTFNTNDPDLAYKNIINTTHLLENFKEIPENYEKLLDFLNTLKLISINYSSDIYTEEQLLEVCTTKSLNKLVYFDEVWLPIKQELPVTPG